jgi:hypothetical protein
MATNAQDNGLAAFTPEKGGSVKPVSAIKAELDGKIGIVKIGFLGLILLILACALVYLYIAQPQNTSAQNGLIGLLGTGIGFLISGKGN